LDEDLITGPFEWNGEPRYTIDKEHWEALRQRGHQSRQPIINEQQEKKKRITTNKRDPESTH
jgi:hypothetical protein